LRLLVEPAPPVVVTWLAAGLVALVAAVASIMIALLTF
jgi:hypothetical protein